MGFGWEPIPWNLGFFRSRSNKRGFAERTRWPLVWRKTGDAEWPPSERVDADLDWARRTGTGFVSDSETERLYLIDRDWFGWPDPPRWGLASKNKSDGSWHLWGSFDNLPPAWSFADEVDPMKVSRG
jgi:hypothetical protein